ncbi:putative secretory protein [Pseudoalteromonas luteoviolacea B = ATCC 29581]|nr:putative secretory protein [Pseudoalteromonas luteoviolacea B = ATCC 29581]
MKKHTLAFYICALLSSPLIYAENFPLKPIQFESEFSWQAFKLPEIRIQTQSSKPTTQWNQITPSVIAAISQNVARLLYRTERDSPNLASLTIVLKDMDGVAYKEGDFNAATVFISNQYLETYHQKHGSKATFDELVGILYHEIAHTYQYDDANYAEIGPIIEGIADLVRLKAGYVDFSARKVGGNFDSGYKITAFYLAWLEQKFKEDYLMAINASLSPYDKQKWTWDFFALRLNLDLVKSWNDYQVEISGIRD